MPNFFGIRFWSLALLAVGFIGQFAQADSVSVSPSAAVGNTQITVTVTGFDPNGTGTTSALFYLNGSFWGSCAGPGSCSRVFGMPSCAGDYLVEARCCGVSYAFTHFTVLSPSFMMDHTCITNGGKLILTGFQYAAGANVVTYLDGDAAHPSSNFTDSEGRFTTVYPVSMPAGPHTMTAAICGTTIVRSFVVGSNTCRVLGRVQNLACGQTGCPTVTHPGGQPQKLSPDDPLQTGDILETGAGEHLNVLLPDGTLFSLGQNAKITMDEYVYDPANGLNDRGNISLLRGAFEYTSGRISHHDDNVKFHSSPGELGRRGTQFISRQDLCSTTQEVYLIQGQLSVKPLTSSVTNIVNAPATIFFDATNVWTNGLTQATYDALKNEINSTNPPTFGAWLVQYFGCTNGNPLATATADPDGDGQNNYAEFQSHTDPTTNASVFKLLGAAREGNGVRINWQTHGGITNVVQAAANVGGSFSDISSNVVIPGSEDATTNFFHSGIVTNAAARFYRVRLAP